MDIAGRGLKLRVACACGHRAELDARALCGVYWKRGWNTRVHMIGDHLRCTRCGRRRPAIG